VKLGIRETNGVTVVDVSGRVTMGEGAGTLRESISQLAASGHRRILLNLAELTSIDSSGIGVLVSGFATLNRLEGHLKLINLNSRVKDLLLITKLYTVFEIYEDEVRAAASFSEVSAGAPAGA
jgi:anti-sigma B factor antagonist